MTIRKKLCWIGLILSLLQACGGSGGAGDGVSAGDSDNPTPDPTPTPTQTPTLTPTPTSTNPEAGAANPIGPMEAFAEEHKFHDTARNLNRSEWGTFAAAQNLVGAADHGYVGNTEAAEINKHSASHFASVFLKGSAPVDDSKQFSVPSALKFDDGVIEQLTLLSEDLLSSEGWSDPDTGYLTQGQLACELGGYVYIQRDIIEDSLTGHAKSTALFDFQGCIMSDQFDGMLVSSRLTDSDGYNILSTLGFNSLKIRSSENQYSLTGAVTTHYRDPNGVLFSAHMLLSGVDNNQQTLFKIESSDKVPVESDFRVSNPADSAQTFVGELYDTHYGHVSIATPAKMVLTLAPDYVAGYDYGLYREYINNIDKGNVVFTGRDNASATFSWIGQGVVSSLYRTPVRGKLRLSNAPEDIHLADRDLILNSVWLDRLDTDVDGIENGLERYLAMDPLTADDANFDLDDDGYNLKDEIINGTNPIRYDLVPNQSLSINWKQLYEPTTNSIEAYAQVSFNQQLLSGFNTVSIESQTALLRLSDNASFAQEDIPSACTYESPQAVSCTQSLTNDGIASLASIIDVPVQIVDNEKNIVLTAELLDQWHIIAIEAASTSELQRYSQSPKIDLQAPMLEQQLTYVDSEKTITATIDQHQAAPKAVVSIELDAGPQTVITNASLNSSGNPALLSRCSIGQSTVCEISDVAPGDTLTVEVTVKALAEGADVLSWSVVSDVPEWDLSNNTAVTNLLAVNAMALIQNLVDVAEPGESVQLPGGTYIGALNMDYKQVNLVGAPGLEKTILLSDQPDQPLIVSPGNWTTLDNLVLQTNGSPIIKWPGENVTISNSVIEPVPSAQHTMTSLAIANDGQSFRIRGSLVRNWGQGESNQCDSLLAQITAFSYPIYIFLEQNVFENNDCTTLFDMQDDPNDSYSMQASLNLNNNTFVGNHHILKLRDGLPRYNGKFRLRNNIVVGAKTIVDLIDDDDDVDHFDAWLETSNNLIWDSDEQSVLSVDELAENGINVLEYDVYIDPQFVNSESGNYRLTANSPAVDAGVEPWPYLYSWTNGLYENKTPSDSGLIQAVDGNNDGVREFDQGAYEFKPE